MKNMNPRLQKVLSGGLPSGARGSVLIVAVITMVIMGVLGAGMVSMLGTSALQEVRANFGERAYYVAESGFRFAAAMSRDASHFWGLDYREREDPYIEIPSGGRFKLELTNISEEENYHDAATLTDTNLPTVDLDEADERYLILNPQYDEENLKLSKYGAFRYNGSWYRYQGYERSDSSVTLNKILSVTSKRKVKEAGTDADGLYLLLERGPYVANNDWNFEYDNVVYGYGSYSSNKLRDITKDGVDLDTLEDLENEFPPEITLIFKSKTPFTVSVDDEIVFAPILQVKSEGEYPGSGLFNVKRMVTYLWPGGIPKAPPTDPGDDDTPGDLYIEPTELVDNNVFKNNASTGEWVVMEVGEPANDALTVDKSTGGVRVETVIGYSSDPNPFYVAWMNAGNFLTYDAQVKISMGEPTGDTFTVPEDNTGYLAGISFRVRADNYNVGKWRQFGLSFFKPGMETTAFNDDDGIPASLVPTGVYDNLVNGTYEPGTIGCYNKTAGGRTKVAYYRCNAGASEVCTVATSGLSDNWVPYNMPMILLWERGHRNVDGDEWIAYARLSTEGGAPIVSDIIDDDTGELPRDANDNLADGTLKAWSTLILRIVEAASIKIKETATTKEVGDSITDDNTGKAAKVIKIINDRDGNIVFLLNNVEEGFSRPSRVEGIDTDATWGYRQRDNYIWAFFADTDEHPNANDIAIGDDERHANPRLTNDEAQNPESIDQTSENQKIFWPEKNIQEWGAYLPRDNPAILIKNDFSRLVQWEGSDSGTNDNYTVHIMGTGKEEKAILRTSIFLTDGYATFPSEFGLHAIGANAVNTYFDDIAITFHRSLYTGEEQEDYPYIPVITF